MPPPPPNFLPANRRRRLDPSRRLVSRELWNEVRRSRDGIGDESDDAWVARTTSLLRAIAYEIQPFPILPALRRASSFVRDDGEDGLRMIASAKTGRALSSMRSCARESWRLLSSARRADHAKFASDHRSLFAKSAAILAGLRAYHRALVYLHDLLAIGPIVVILTLFGLMYTIGLGDNTGASGGVPSAYSVFNRGMRRLLGTVDGEELARQYAGGGGAAIMANRGGYFVPGGDDDDDLDDDGGGIWEEMGGDDGEDEDDVRDRVNERRRRRRLERLRRRGGNDGGEDDGGGGGGGGAAATEGDVDDDEDVDDAGASDDDRLGGDDGGRRDAAADDRRRPTNEGGEDGTALLAAAAAAAAAAGGVAAVGGARKSGKKARRKDLDARREIQRQRRAAAAMGFGGAGGGDLLAIDDVREIEARMALLG